MMPRDPTAVPSRTDTLKAPTWGPYELAGLPRKPGSPPKARPATTLPPMTALAPRSPVSIQSSEQLITPLSSSLSTDSTSLIEVPPKTVAEPLPPTELLPPTEPPQNGVSVASGAAAAQGISKAEVLSLHDERRAEAMGLQRRLEELGSRQQEAIHVYSEQGEKVDSLIVTVSEVLEANQTLIKDNTVTATAMKEMADKHRALQAMLATVQSRAEAWREQVEASVSLANAKKLAYKALRKGTAMQAMAGAIDRCQQFRKTKLDALIAMGDIPNRYQNPVADLVGLKRRLIAQRKLMHQRDLGASSDPVDPPDVLFAACYLAVVLRAMVVRRFHHVTRLIINNKTEVQRQKATAVMSHLRRAFQLRKRRMFATFRQNTAAQAVQPSQPASAVLDAFQYPPTASLPVLVDKAAVRVPDYYTRLLSVRESAALKSHYLPVEQENPRTTYRTRRRGPSLPFHDDQLSKDMDKRPLPELVRPKADVRVDKRVRDLASSH